MLIRIQSEEKPPWLIYEAFETVISNLNQNILIKENYWHTPIFIELMIPTNISVWSIQETYLKIICSGIIGTRMQSWFNHWKFFNII